MIFDIINYFIIHIIVFALIPLFDSIIKNTKAFFYGRKGPRLMQTYIDIYKLIFRKDELFISEFTSSISSLSVIVIFCINIIFFFLIPISFSIFDINILFLFYFITIASFFMILYGLDNATYFGGLGSERELFLLILIEPTLILMLSIFGILSNSFGLESIHNFILNINSEYIYIYILICMICFWFILLGENKRFPFDNPATHLELTMIHEAFLLETSSKQLGILEFSSKISLIAFLGIFIYIFLPFDFGVNNLFLENIIRFLKLLFLIILIGIWEVFITKIRIFKYTNIYLLLVILQVVVLIVYFLK